MQYLFHVVNQAVEPPLDVDLPATAQGKSIKSFLCPYIAKDRFHVCQPLAVDRPALHRVNFLFHGVGQTPWPATVKQSHLPRPHVGISQTPGAQWTVLARALRRPIRGGKIAALRFEVLPILVKALAGWTDQFPCTVIQPEIFRAKPSFLGFVALLMFIHRTPVSQGFYKSRITFAELTIRNISVNLRCFTGLQIIHAVVAGTRPK